MYKVNYDILTGDILGYYPDFIEYKSIPQPFIIIDNECYNDCINNPNKRKVDVTRQVIVEKQEEIKTNIITPLVDKEKADLWEAILALSQEIEKLKGNN